MATLSSYSAKNHRLVVGPHIVTAPAEDMFTVAPVGDGTQSEAGAYGDVVRSISHDTRFQITVNLQFGSLSSKVFTALRKRDQVTGDSPVPILLTNIATGQVVCAGTGWIVNAPEAGYAAAAAARAWTLEYTGEYNPE